MPSRRIESRLRRVRRLRPLGAGLLLAAVMVSPWVCASEIVTDAAPPPPQTEHAPPHRDGYVWGAGHWEWNGRSYVWVSGTWILERRSAHWVDARWEQMGARWHYSAGHWER